MADYIVKDTELTSVANAIRTAGGTNSLLNFPNGFVSAVNNISGGGSSDFSTATVTFSGIGTEGSVAASMPLIITTGGGFPFDAILPTQRAVENTSYTIALYKDKAVIFVELAGAGDITISGSAESLGNGAYLVTGDCTITIS
jgi:hypothetical protein